MNKLGSITAAELDDLRKEIVIEIKSILCSAKRGLTEYELKKEYRQINGKEIPYASLGHNSLYELMRSMPEACYSQRHHASNIWVYYPHIDETVKNLADLVRGQKTDKLTKLREQYRSQVRQNNSNSSNRFQRISYSSSTQFRTAQNGYSTIMPANYARNVPADVQEQIRCILANNNGRLPLGDFEKLYQLKHYSKLDFSQYGFNSMRHLFESLPHLVSIQTQSGTFDSTDLICLIEPIIQQMEKENSAEVLAESDVSVLAKNLPPPGHSVKTESRKRHLSPLEEEITNSIITLLKTKKSIALSDFKMEYEGLVKKSLEFEKLGYQNIPELVKGLEIPGVRVTCVLPTYENILVYEDDQEKKIVADEVTGLSDSDDEYGEEYLRMQLRKLEPHIKTVFKARRRTNLQDFLSLFEKHNGWKLEFKTYGFRNNESLFAALKDLDLIRAELVDGKFVFNCDHLLETRSERLSREKKISLQQALSQNRLDVRILFFQ